MHTSHYILKYLVDERAADLRRDRATRRPKLDESGRTYAKATRPTRVPVQVTRRRHLRLPITARGVAWLEDYHSQGR